MNDVANKFNLFIHKMKRAATLDREFLSIVGNKWVQRIKEEFDGAHDPFGHAWQKNTHDGSKVLIKSGHLRRSFHFSATQKELKVGSPVPYSANHQFGLNGFHKNQMLPLEHIPDSWLSDINKAFSEHIAEVMGH